MTPQQFIKKWKESALRERQAAQSHFNNLCALLGVENPTDADPKGEWYCFERGAKKSGGGDGWADVWKRDHFGWEYKGKRKDLNAAYAQLQQYAVALDNPPLLVVCDTEEFRIHTNWPNTVSQIHVIQLEELADAGLLQKLKYVFTDPERLKPAKTRDALTAEMAEKFARLAKTLADRGHNAELVAHFLNRLIFCMFAEDSDLLPNQMFTRMLNHAFFKPEEFNDVCGDLFRVMKSGGRIGLESVDWFNGGLFDDDLTVPLNRSDIGIVLEAAKMNWTDVDPSILGTLFERGLDPDKRGELGAHYTDREKIMLIVKPVIRRPLQAEWTAIKAKIAEHMAKAEKAKSPAARKKETAAAEKLHGDYVDKLASLRVLDPACGSGNFLYLALRTLKDLEHKANLEAEELGLAWEPPKVGPQVVKGIEISPYAAELARVSIWIGELQWMKRHGFDVSKNPILKPLETIENRDALLNADGTEAEWPKADFIIGNPPYVANKDQRKKLGEGYVPTLRRSFSRYDVGLIDFITYWFIKVGDSIREHPGTTAGLVATNSVRQIQNRRILEEAILRNSLEIFEAWSNEPWVTSAKSSKASVRVSMICLRSSDSSNPRPVRLDGKDATSISAELTLLINEGTQTMEELPENKGVAFNGTKKYGSFEISKEIAATFLSSPLNPNGRPNADVILPWIANRDIVRRPGNNWIIDLNEFENEVDAALFELPFSYARENVFTERQSDRNPRLRQYWWMFEAYRKELRRRQSELSRFIVTPVTSKYRLFRWLSGNVIVDQTLTAICRDDDTTFGVLHAKAHELWSLKSGGWMGVGDDPRYTATTTFQTFPFPEGLTPNIPAKDYAKNKRAIAIAEAAKKLNGLREAWLNPPDLVKREPEVVPGYPDRILPKDAKAEKELKKRTLTNLYNARPAWLANAHKALDDAVAAAYGWPTDLSDDEILKRLFDLNQERAKAQAEKA